MFWNSNKEINKVINRYGAVKGAEFLTYFYTYIHKVIHLRGFTELIRVDQRPPEERGWVWQL